MIKWDILLKKETSFLVLIVYNPRANIWLEKMINNKTGFILSYLTGSWYESSSQISSRQIKTLEQGL